MTLCERSLRGIAVSADVSQQRHTLISPRIWTQLEISSDFGVDLISFDLLYSNPIKPHNPLHSPASLRSQNAGRSAELFQLAELSARITKHQN